MNIAIRSHEFGAFNSYDRRKRYAAVAAIVLLHAIAWNLLHHAKLAAALRNAGKADIKLFFLPDTPKPTPSQRQEPVAADIRRIAPVTRKTGKPMQPIAITPPAADANQIHLTPEEAPAETQPPHESIVAKTLRSIPEIHRQMRREGLLPPDTPDMWKGDRFERAIGAVANSRDAGSETYVDSDGRVVTRVGSNCMAQVGDSEPDGVDHMQRGLQLKVVPCSH